MFSKSSSTTPPEQVNTPKPAKPPVAGAAPSIIGADVKVVGDLSTTGEIQLDGIVEGDVHSAALTLGENGQVKGSITAESVVVKGTVSGQISARSIRLEKSARVTGDLYHEIISVEAGATIEGHFVNSTGAGRPGQKSEGGMKLVSGTTESASTPEHKNASA